MKKLKKLLLFICFALSFVLVACNEEEFVGYRINVVYLSSQGSYTIEASDKKDGLYGGKVSLTANPKAGYEFDHFIINGKEVNTNPYVAEEILSNLDVTIYFALEGSENNNGGGSNNGGNTNNGGNSNNGNNDVVIEGSYAGDYYKSLDMNSLSSDELFDELRKLLTETHTHKTTYNELKTKLQYTDASLEDENKIMLFYAQKPFDGEWKGGDTWNREHVWPQSLSWFTTSGAGADIHHIRPTDNVLNSTRGNRKFAELSVTSYLVSGASTGRIQTKCKVDGDRFEPADEIKGDVARILMYLLVRYPESDGYTITIVCTSMDMLLKWNKQDPVSEFEARRNERSYEIQGNRNPFIDYPSLADKIWG